MPIVSDRNYGQLLTAAVAKRSREIQDIAYKANPITAILLNENRIKRRTAGGPELRIPVEFDRLIAQWFTGYDKIRITPKELLNSAVFNWSRVVSMFSLTGTELDETRGEEEIIDLLSFHMEAAEKSVKESFEAALIGDGTAEGGRQMLGLGAAVPIIPNAGIYGGIDRAAVPSWRTNTFDIPNGDVAGYTEWNSGTARQILNKVVLSRSRGSNYADLLLADMNSYQALDSAIVAHQRLVSNRMTSLGFDGGFAVLTPAGRVDVVAAGGIGAVMPADTAFGLDTKSMALYTFPGREFVPFHEGGGARPINQDAIAQGILWAGQFVMENPLSNFRLITA